MFVWLIDTIQDSGNDIDACWDGGAERRLMIVDGKSITVPLVDGWIEIHKLRVLTLSDWHGLVYSQGAFHAVATYQWPEFSIRDNNTVEFLRNETLYKLLRVKLILDPLDFAELKQKDVEPVVVLSDQKFAMGRADLVLDHFYKRKCSVCSNVTKESLVLECDHIFCNVC